MELQLCFVSRHFQLSPLVAPQLGLPQYSTVAMTWCVLLINSPLIRILQEMMWLNVHGIVFVFEVNNHFKQCSLIPAVM